MEMPPSLFSAALLAREQAHSAAAINKALYHCEDLKAKVKYREKTNASPQLEYVGKGGFLINERAFILKVEGLVKLELEWDQARAQKYNFFLERWSICSCSR